MVNTYGSSYYLRSHVNVLRIGYLISCIQLLNRRSILLIISHRRRYALMVSSDWILSYRISSTLDNYILWKMPRIHTLMCLHQISIKIPKHFLHETLASQLIHLFRNCSFLVSGYLKCQLPLSSPLFILTF